MGIKDQSIGTFADYSDTEFINRVVNISGVVANIFLASLAVLILFILHCNSSQKDSLIFVYNKKLHSLIEQKYHFLINGNINFKMFLLIFALANLLLILFTFLLYPYSGVL